MSRPVEKKSVFELLMFVSGLVGLWNITNWAGDKVIEWLSQASDAEATLLLKIDEHETELTQLKEKLAELRAARTEVEAVEATLSADNDNRKSRPMPPVALPLSIRF